VGGGICYFPSRVANWHFEMPNNSNLAFLGVVWQEKFWVWQFAVWHTFGIFCLVWQLIFSFDNDHKNWHYFGL